MDEVNDRARCGHPQALAHDRRGLGGDRRAARRADGPGRRQGLRRAGRLGARARRRAGLGDRGLPARLGLLRAVSDRARRAGPARHDEADGRHRGARARERGKSDSIDAIAVARAALREGLDALPAAQLDGPELDLRLLVDHRERLVRQRVALNNTLQWHLHDLWPELELPGSSLFYGNWGPRVARRLARAEQTMRVRIARDELRRIRELSQTIKALERRDRRARRRRSRRSCSTEPGFGPLTAAKLVGEIAGAGRFATDAKLARAAGVAPIPVSSGKTNRHRLDRGGNRQINATIHRIAVTRLRCHPETQDYIARKRAEGKSTKEAIRCLKRHLARRIWHLLQRPRPVPTPHTINLLT